MAHGGNTFSDAISVQVRNMLGLVELRDALAVVIDQNRLILSQNREILAKLRSLMDQVSVLQSTLVSASNGLSTLAVDVQGLVTMLQNSEHAADLSSEIAAATALSNGLNDLDTTVKAQLNPTPTPTPAPSPAPTPEPQAPAPTA